MPASAAAGGAAAFAPGAGISLKDLQTVFPDASADALARVHDLLARRPGGEEGLAEFGTILDRLMSATKQNTSTEDNLEHEALTNSAFRQEALETLAPEEMQGVPEGGAAGLGDAIAKLWEGAKGSLRVATYWQMKNRAGVVGKLGLAPLVDGLADAVPDLRIHLVGHSFGARLVSFSLAGLRAREVSPVKSLFLLQGAFSHFAFADTLPFDRNRSGELKGMASRVDGPLLATFSDFDLAVGRSYPLASVVAGQDASDAQKVVSRWGAMGSDGAQAVSAVAFPLVAAGHKYTFQKGKWHNLDGNDVIKNGDPPSGAHGDIIHPQIAWVALSAAGVV
jgi:hypothetical protein